MVQYVVYCKNIIESIFRVLNRYHYNKEKDLYLPKGTGLEITSPEIVLEIPDRRYKKIRQAVPRFDIDKPPVSEFSISEYTLRKPGRKQTEKLTDKGKKTICDIMRRLLLPAIYDLDTEKAWGYKDFKEL